MTALLGVMLAAIQALGLLLLLGLVAFVLLVVVFAADAFLTRLWSLYRWSSALDSLDRLQRANDSAAAMANVADAITTLAISVSELRPPEYLAPSDEDEEADAIGDDDVQDAVDRIIAESKRATGDR